MDATPPAGFWVVTPVVALLFVAVVFWFVAVAA